MPSATFSHAASVTQPAGTIWDRLQEVDAWANIGPLNKVWDAIHDGDLLRGYKWRTTVGPTNYDGKASVVASERPHLMRLDLDAGEVTGSLETRMTSNGDGSTQIVVTLEVVSRGMLSTLFFPVLSEAVGRGLPDQVDQFARSFRE
jgi:hypothetical protein